MVCISFSFWIIYFHKPSSKLLSILKKLTVILILAGIFTIYSRTTILSLLISFGLFYLTVLFRRDKF